MVERELLLIGTVCEHFINPALQDKPDWAVLLLGRLGINDTRHNMNRCPSSPLSISTSRDLTLAASAWYVCF
jgi:hypothetical protein